MACRCAQLVYEDAERAFTLAECNKFTEVVVYREDGDLCCEL